MDNISNVNFTDCVNSLYIKPRRILYEQDGKQKFWDVVKIHDSVAIIIFNVSRHVLIFVKQFRPAVYHAQFKAEDMEGFIDTKKFPPSMAMTIELCAGIVDKDKSLEETAQEEVLEECGYSVPLSSIQKVTSYKSGVGESGAHQILYYVEVTDEMKVTDGGGIASEGEFIDVIEMDMEKARALMYDENVARPASIILGLLWFFNNKHKST